METWNETLARAYRLSQNRRHDALDGACYSIGRHGLSAAVVEQLIKSNSAVIKGTSSRNTPTTDTVSLAGFSAAYKTIGDTCKKP